MFLFVRYILLGVMIRSSNALISVGGRRDAIRKFLPPLIISSTIVQSDPAYALLLGPAKDRRQLELCLVNILRVKYWGQNLSVSLENSLRGNPTDWYIDAIKAPYLEARLGGKALLTGKVGGGANGKVYTLASFQIKGVVKDIISYEEDIYNSELKSASTKEEKMLSKQKRNTIETAGYDLIESLATLNEFDGLDNLQDPSPRSSLFLSQYTTQKSEFLLKLLQLRVIPSCDTLLDGFGAQMKDFVEKYVQVQYSNEVFDRRLS